MADLEDRFTAIGTQFVPDISNVRERLENVSTFLFDWDGVFNDGTKGHQVTSHFTEADSMGVNMLRFSYWLKHGSLPYCGIITGRKNESAVHFAQREHFNLVFMGYTDKTEAVREGDLNISSSAFFFDDILDLSLAADCALRVMIRRDQSPLMTNSVIEKQWCDVITANSGGSHAIREACELLIGLNGNWDEVLDSRVAFNEKYSKYLDQRAAIATVLNEKSR